MKRVCYIARPVRIALMILALACVSGCRSRGEALLEAGDAAAAKGDWAQAAVKWAEAANALPGSALPSSRLGHARWKLNDAAGARTAWEATLVIDERNEGALTGLATLELAQGNAAQAMPHLEALTPPLSATAERLKVRTLLARGAEGDVAEALTLAASLGAETESRFLYGSALLAAGQLDEARETFNALPAAWSNYGLARLAAARGDATETLNLLEACKAAAGTAWRSEAVARDPAFEFVAETPEFKAVTAR